MSEQLDKVREAAQVFLDAISDSFWEEHGISADEAEKGLIAALLQLGFMSDEDGAVIRAEIKAEEEAASAKRRAEAQARYEAMTPRQRESHDMLRSTHEMMMRIQSKMLAKTVFASAPFYAKLLDNAPERKD